MGDRNRKGALKQQNITNYGSDRLTRQSANSKKTEMASTGAGLGDGKEDSVFENNGMEQVKKRVEQGEYEVLSKGEAAEAVLLKY